MTAEKPVVLLSSSAAMDGGLTAVADVSGAMTTAGAADHYRLIGGVTVLLHVQRLGLDLPLRATGDADFGVTPFVLHQAKLVDAIEALGYHKTAGNRWERPIDDRRVAVVDLLVPTYRSRARNTVRVGAVVTTEVPGLAEALRRPGIALDVEMHLTDKTQHRALVIIPDAVGTLALKAGARTVRNETRDAEDLWRCLEVAAADGVTPVDFEDPALSGLRQLLTHELGDGGSALPMLTAGLQGEAAARMRTRLRALLAEVVGGGT
ncbi:MAG: hypothetical protein JWN46_1934 [Acidimicrobiales bacterium]|nr:hypothetical protein [Acidimicrobiales bacterium]